MLRKVRREAGLTNKLQATWVERGEVHVLEFVEWCEACSTPSEQVIKKI